MNCNHNHNSCAPQTKRTRAPPDAPCSSSKHSMLVPSPEASLEPSAATTNCFLAVTAPTRASSTPRSAAIATSSGTRHRHRDAVCKNALVTVEQDKMDHDDADKIGAQSLIALAARTLPDGTGNANQTKRKRGGLQQGGMQQGGMQQGGLQQGGLQGVDVFVSHVKQKILTNQPRLTLVQHLRYLMSPASNGENARNNVLHESAHKLPKRARKRLRGTFNDYLVDVWNNELSNDQREPYNKWAEEITRRLTRQTHDLEKSPVAI